MFLPVKPAACAEALERLTRMVETILAYSVESSLQMPDLVELKARVEPLFQPLLDRRRVQDAVQAVFRLSDASRQEVYAAFHSDAAFPQHIGDGAYRLSSLSGSCAEALDQLCNTLYDIARDGLREDGTERFSARLLKKEYAAANGWAGRVCPVCARELLFAVGEGEADHYFPRKKYPALAMHPHNLLPTCADCNGTQYKHDKSPIASEDAGPGALQTVFLPYLRPAMPEVELGVTEDCEIAIRPGPHADAHTPRRIENLERLYRLGERWSVTLSYVYDDVSAELASGTLPDEAPAKRLAALRGLLGSAAASTKARPELIKGVYFQWLREKSDAELEAIFFQPRLASEPVPD